MSACIGEPISWLRLERVAAGVDDAPAGAHLATCAACRSALEEIRRDVVALPVLHVMPKRRWWTWVMPAMVAAAAVATILFVMRPRDPGLTELARVKGVGQVEVDVVRERDGAIRDDVRSFAYGDRWKVIVTCPPNATAWIDVAVIEAGAERADYPVAPAQIACGNRVVIPGAFVLTGAKRHRVCARVGAGAPPTRSLPRDGDDNVACVTISPE
ncbi:MAG: hypothetical protein JWO36_5851 [Myxococcales bacterium]|nr:hypothetical protein [Myxococcales bacterium]